MTDTPTDRESVEHPCDIANLPECMGIPCEGYRALLGAKKKAEADRNALREKLEAAKQSLSNSRETHCGLAEYILQGGTNTKGIFTDSQRARLSIDATLATLDQPKEGGEDE